MNSQAPSPGDEMELDPKLQKELDEHLEAANETKNRYLDLYLHLCQHATYQKFNELTAEKKKPVFKYVEANIFKILKDFGFRKSQHISLNKMAREKFGS